MSFYAIKRINTPIDIQNRVSTLCVQNTHSFIPTHPKLGNCHENSRIHS
jgi:hypothetical protein